MNEIRGEKELPRLRLPRAHGQHLPVCRCKDERALTAAATLARHVDHQLGRPDAIYHRNGQSADHRHRHVPLRFVGRIEVKAANLGCHAFGLLALDVATKPQESKRNEVLGLKGSAHACRPLTITEAETALRRCACHREKAESEGSGEQEQRGAAFLQQHALEAGAVRGKKTHAQEQHLEWRG
jgi:hypothetical protein